MFGRWLMPTTAGDAKLLDRVYCVPDVSHASQSVKSTTHARTHARNRAQSRESAIARARNNNVTLHPLNHRVHSPPTPPPARGLIHPPTTKRTKARTKARRRERTNERWWW